MYLSEKPRPIDFYKAEDSSSFAPRDMIIESVLPSPADLPPPPPPHPHMLLPDPPSPSAAGGPVPSSVAPKKRAETWVQDETRCLISLRRDIDALFNTSKSNKHLWDQISVKMREKGFDRSPTMCTDKWRNLLKEFKKASKYQYRKMSYYKEIEEILRDRSKNPLYKTPTPSSTKVDSFMQFSDKGMEETGISFGPVEVTVNCGSSQLRDYVEYLGDAARVVLVPSIRDANHDFVFPQPGFDIRSSDLNHQITNLTNPGIFEANQVKVGCCTVDILKQLSGEEMSRNPSDGIPSDRMSRLAYHVLSQRSFYPLYPPAEDVPLDFSLAPDTVHFSLIPDILILPSDMKYFVKIVSLGGRNEGEEKVKCICINPGRLAKGEGAGTFVELHYNGNPDTANASIIGI